MARYVATKNVEEIRSLTEENETLRADLDKCKDVVLELLEEENQVSEASIKKDYTCICKAIEGWIDNVTANAEKDDFKKHYMTMLGTEEWQFMFEDQGLDLENLADYKSADYFVLSFVVQRQLEGCIFKKPYPIGVTVPQAEVIDEVERGMNSPSLGKAQLSIDKWRSEALTALTTLHSFKQHQADALEEIISHAEDAISPWVPDRNAFAKHKAVLQREIFHPAVKLHQAMCTSIRQYVMPRPELRSGTILEQPLDKSWTLKDIGTWRKVKNINEIQRVIYCLYPAIVRLGLGDEETAELVNPVVVVNSTMPMTSYASSTPLSTSAALPTSLPPLSHSARRASTSLSKMSISATQPPIRTPSSHESATPPTRTPRISSFGAFFHVRPRSRSKSPNPLQIQPPADPITTSNPAPQPSAISANLQTHQSLHPYGDVSIKPTSPPRRFSEPYSPNMTSSPTTPVRSSVRHTQNRKKRHHNPKKSFWMT